MRATGLAWLASVPCVAFACGTPERGVPSRSDPPGVAVPQRAVRAESDFDGDGFADLAVAAPGADRHTGRVFVYRGTRSGWGTSPDLALSVSAPPETRFGSSLAITDVDRDGRDDLIVGTAHGGHAYVFRGTPSGLGAVADGDLEDPDAGPAFGHVVAAVGDVDGDGYDDVAVADDGSPGRVDVFFGSAGGVKSDRVAIHTDVEAGSSFGASIAGVGDVDGDGFDDFAIGQPYLSDANAFGRAWVVYGGARSTVGSRRDALANPDRTVVDFGYQVSRAGDLDGDGRPDVLVGTWSPAGRVYVFRGAPGGIEPTPWQTLAAADAGALHFGQSMLGGVDLDGDGRSDLVVGASGSDSESTGRVYFYRGVSGGFELSQTRDGGAGEGFGWSLAARRNTVLIGAPFADTSRGTVRAFDLGSTTAGESWSTTSPFAEFGRSL